MSFMATPMEVLGGQAAPPAKGTNTLIFSSVDPSVNGNSVMITAAVAPTTFDPVVPTGSVTIVIDGSPQSPAALQNGLASLSRTFSTAIHAIIGGYSGSGYYQSGTSGLFSQVTNASFVTPWQPLGINVTAHGVVGDGTTDNTTALQNLVNASTNGSLFYFPAGNYLISGTVAFGGLRGAGIIGDINTAGAPTSIITGTSTTAAPITFDYGGGNEGFQVLNMQFNGSTSGGTGFYTNNAADAEIRNCQFRGTTGLNVLSGFAVAVRSCTFTGIGASGSIGILMQGDTEDLLEECVITGWDEGMRSAGAGASIIRTSISSCKTGLRLGADATGANHTFSRASLDSLTISNCDIGIRFQSTGFIYFSNSTITGSNSAPSGTSQHGVQIDFCQGQVFNNVNVTGTFSGSSWLMTGGQYSVFYACPGFSVPGGLTGVVAFASSLSVATSLDDLTAALLVYGQQVPVVNVTANGVVGNGSTNNSTVMQALVNSSAAGTIFYFPTGNYLFGSTVDFSGLANFTLTGDVNEFFGSKISANFAGPIFKADYGTGAGTVKVQNLYFKQNSTAAGSRCLCLKNTVMSSMWNFGLSGGEIGLEAVNPFWLCLRSGSLNGLTAIYLNGLRFCTLEQCDSVGSLVCGLLANGDNLHMYACRFESGAIGMNLGKDFAGNTVPLTNSTIVGISEEANNYHLVMTGCSGCVVGGMGAGGSTNAPAGLSIAGITVIGCYNCQFIGIGNSGSYSGPSISVDATSHDLLFAAVQAANSRPGGITWQIDPAAQNIQQLSTY